MLDVKNNFRGKYIQRYKMPEHVLETCPGIHTDPSTKITTNEIFENDTKKIKTTSTKITNILKEIQIYIFFKPCVAPQMGRAIWRSRYTHVVVVVVCAF